MPRPSATGASILAVVALLSLPATSFAEPPARASKGAEEPRAAVRLLANVLRDNAAFASTHGADFFAPMKEGQHPRATVVMCADSRVHSHDFEAMPEGDLFVVRNIGNQIDSTPGSVAYGIHHLHTPVLLIVGHVGCGAVKAALTDYSAESPELRRELDGLHLSIAHTRQGLSDDARWLDGVFANVHQQVENAVHEYTAEVKSGELVVVGAVYDFKDELKGGAGRLHIVNVNGERDATRLAKLPLLVEAKKRAAAR